MVSAWQGAREMMWRDAFEKIRLSLDEINGLSDS